MPVNAPEAGIIKELLVSEEDTVVVGQDLLRLELGGAPKDGGEKKDSAPKPEAKDTSADSKPKAPESQPEAASEKPAPEQSKPAAKQESQPAPRQDSGKPSPQESSVNSTEGNREERRVSFAKRPPRFPVKFTLTP